MQQHANRAIYSTLKYWRNAGISSIELPEQEMVEPEIDKVAELQKLALETASCTACPLHEKRKGVVFGKGSMQVKVLFIGSSPDGVDEDSGTPFVGEAGKLLDRMIGKMGLKSEQVYFTFSAKCRPPSDRNAKKEELKACGKILEKQINLIAPKIICTLGTVASSSLLEIDLPISKMRGQIKKWHNIPVMPTFSPLYLLKKPNARHDVWQDMQKILEVLS